MTQSFTDIIAWQKAHEFVLIVYSMTRCFPVEERYGLSSQFQRAAVSIPANIAEGYKRLGKSDKLRFLNISQGSLEECRYYIILSKDLEYISDERFQVVTNKIEEVSRVLNAYSKGIVTSHFDG